MEDGREAGGRKGMRRFRKGELEEWKEKDMDQEEEEDRKRKR